MKPSDDNPLTRPGPAHPDITDPDIAKLVATFYARAREDDVLGPVFNRAVHDWDEHIAQITDFWSSIMLRGPAVLPTISSSPSAPCAAKSARPGTLASAKAPTPIIPSND